MYEYTATGRAKSSKMILHSDPFKFFSFLMNIFKFIFDVIRTSYRVHLEKLVRVKFLCELKSA